MVPGSPSTAGALAAPPSRPKLAILGTGTSLRHAPFSDPDFAWWGPAYLYDQVPCFHVGFHVYDQLSSQEVPGLWEKLAKSTVPIYMQRVEPTIPGSRAYPLAEVAAAFTLGGRDKPFTTSTATYMLAFAALTMPTLKELHLYGVDMAADSEYADQARSVEFFVGVLVGMGVRVVVPSVSEICKVKFLYGFQHHAKQTELTDLRERLAYFTMKRDEAEANEEACRAERLKFQGVIADTEFHLKRTRL